MATRAVYTFSGFPDEPAQHLYLHHDGYPAGAAFRLAEAKQLSETPAAYLRSFLVTQPEAESLVSPEQSGDAEYRYLVQLSGERRPAVRIECWRRYPGESHWQRRCGPMLLASFINRFLPDLGP